MLITKETDYAIRVLRVLSKGDLCSVPEISKEGQIPTDFTYKIARKLAKAGYISVKRGVTGGCRLHADLGTLTLYDIMDAMGETGFVSACMKPGYACAWRKEHGGSCSVHCRLGSIQNNVNRSLKQHSVAALLKDEVNT